MFLFPPSVPPHFAERGSVLSLITLVSFRGQVHSAAIHKLCTTQPKNISHSHSLTSALYTINIFQLLVGYKKTLMAVTLWPCTGMYSVQILAGYRLSRISIVLNCLENDYKSKHNKSKNSQCKGRFSLSLFSSIYSWSFVFTFRLYKRRQSCLKQVTTASF